MNQLLLMVKNIQEVKKVTVFKFLNLKGCRAYLGGQKEKNDDCNEIYFDRYLYSTQEDIVEGIKLNIFGITIIRKIC